jgi:L-fuconolactonase
MPAIVSGPGAAEDAALERWLALTPEHPLDPHLPIIDPHHHFWDARAGEGGSHITLDRGVPPVDPAAVSYGAPNPAGCQQRYLLEDVMNDARGLRLVATVFVECGAMYSKAPVPTHLRSTGETFFVQGLASAAASGTYGPPLVAAGITSAIDLSVGELELAEAVGVHQSCPNFRGFRAGATDAGLALLQERGLVWETGLSPDLAAVAAKFPQLTIVINHCCPRVGNGEEAIVEWKAQIEAASNAGPNVVAKVGGAGMPGFGFGWANAPRPPSSSEVAEATLEYYGHVIDCFGSSRCMYARLFCSSADSCMI